MDSAKSKAPVAVIGLGLLGMSIVQRLAAQGRRLRGWDLLETRRDLAAASGVSLASSAADALEGVETVIFSLPTSDVVAAVLEPLLQEQQSLGGKLFVDTTTGRPQQMVQFERQLAGCGADYVEACVAGSSQQLRDGSAALLLGGTTAALARAEPLLGSLASKRWQLGGAGSGARFKLVHNLVLGLNRAALAEGLAFAESLGFDLESAVDVLRQTPAASAAMAAKGEKMARGEYSPQAKLSQHHKDVRLILEEAAQHGLELPLSLTHERMLALAEQLGWADADNSAVLEAWRRRAGP